MAGNGVSEETWRIRRSYFREVSVMNGTLNEALQAIYQQHGRLTPKIVLDTARDTAHQLHPLFEWDDSIAAEKYRLMQAGQVIARVKIVFPDKEGGQAKVNRYIPVPQDDPGSRNYRDIEELVDDDVSSQIFFAQMEREVRSLHARYGAYSQFWELMQRLEAQSGVTV
jgi:hypothetical protein